MESNNTLLHFSDNLILELQRDRTSIKVTTTSEYEKFKVVRGLWIADSVIDTKYINMRDLKQLLVDSCINGYNIKQNLVFPQGLHGVAVELANERMKQEAISMTENDDKPPLIKKPEEIIEEEVYEKIN
jgi:hypothetical protein